MAQIVVKQNDGKTEAEQHFADVAEALDAAHIQRSALKQVVSSLTALNETGRSVEGDLLKYQTMLDKIETTVAEIRADYRAAQEAMANDSETQALIDEVTAEEHRIRVAFLSGAVGKDGEVSYFGPQSTVRVRGKFLSVDEAKGTLVVEQTVATGHWGSVRTNWKTRNRTVKIAQIEAVEYMSDKQRNGSYWVRQNQYTWLERAQQRVRGAK